jgi:sulfur carrier protein
MAPPAGESIMIRLNGNPRPIAEGTALPALLANLGFAGQPVLVELNGEAVLPSEYPATQLKAGDVIELVRIVAGG